MDNNLSKWLEYNLVGIITVLVLFLISWLLSFLCFTWLIWNTILLGYWSWGGMTRELAWENGLLPKNRGK